MSWSTYVNRVADPSPPAAGCVTIYAKAGVMYAIDDAAVVASLGGVHDIGGAKHAADTLANLNTKVTDAVLDGVGDPRPPTAHTHSHASTTGQTANDHHAQLHAVEHQPGGADPMAVDAAVGTGSLRTLGAGAQQACAGNDARLSDSRAPTGAAGGDLGGNYPNPTVDDGADGSAIHKNIDGEIDGIAVKAAPVDADIVLIEDSAAAFAKNKAALSTLPARNLQAVTDKGNVTTHALAFGATNPPAAYGITGGSNFILLYMGGTVHYKFKNTPTGFYAGNAGRDLGTVTAYPWRIGFIQAHVAGVQDIGDASDTIGYVYEVYITRGAGVNNATLPTAVAGRRFRLHVSGAGGGTVNVVSAAGDRINGGAVPTTLALSNGAHEITAFDATDWFSYGPVALST